MLTKHTVQHSFLYGIYSFPFVIFCFPHPLPPDSVPRTVNAFFFVSRLHRKAWSSTSLVSAPLVMPPILTTPPSSSMTSSSSHSQEPSHSQASNHRRHGRQFPSQEQSGIERRQAACTTEVSIETWPLPDRTSCSLYPMTIRCDDEVLVTTTYPPSGEPTSDLNVVVMTATQEIRF